MHKLLVGVVAGSPESSNYLAALVEETQLVSQILTEQYIAMEDGEPGQRLLQARPDIILVDMENQDAAIHSLSTLHAGLPGTWLLACGLPKDALLIIEAMQAGAREFLPTPVQATALSMAFGRYLDEKQPLHIKAGPKGKIYSITSAKGSMGATSVAVNLAATLSRAPGRRVALLDMTGSLGDIAGYLNLRPRFSFSRAIAFAASLDSALLEPYMEKAGGVSVLSGSGELKANAASLVALARLFKLITESYTDVFIDLPLTLDEQFLQKVIDASVAVLVVTTPELLAVRRTHQLLSLLASWRRNDRLRLILNRDGHQNCLEASGIAKALGYPIFWKLPNNYHAATLAICQGRPLVELDHSSLSMSYRKLTEELTGVAIPKQQRGLLKFARTKSPRVQTVRLLLPS